ncbi:MAG: hypothetical protein ACLFWL_00700 [Candidatus Brocadiia bacterium]
MVRPQLSITPPLPEDIRIKELSDGVRYVLPRKKDVLRWILLGLMVLVAAGCVAILLSGIAGLGDVRLFSFHGVMSGFVRAYLLFLAIGGMFFGLFVSLGHEEIELGSRRLRQSFVFLGLRVSRTRQLRHIRQLVVSALPSVGRAGEQETRKKRDIWSSPPFLLHAVVRGEKVFTIARGHPAQWLVILAEDMANRWPETVQPRNDDRQTASVEIVDLTPRAWGERVTGTSLRRPDPARVDIDFEVAKIMLQARADTDWFLGKMSGIGMAGIMAAMWAWLFLGWPFWFICLGAAALVEVFLFIFHPHSGIFPATLRVEPGSLNSSGIGWLWRSVHCAKDEIKGILVHLCQQRQVGRFIARVEVVSLDGKSRPVWVGREREARRVGKIVAESLGVKLAARQEELPENSGQTGSALPPGKMKAQMEPWDSDKRPQRPGIWPHLKPIAVFSVVFAVVVGGVLLFRGIVMSKFNAVRARIRSLGYPAMIDEVEELIQEEAKGPNAAKIYREAFEKYVDVPEQLTGKIPLLGTRDSPELPEPYEPFPPPLEEAVREYLRLNAEALRKLHEASRIQHCHWSWNVREDPMFREQSFPELLNDGARMLVLRAVVRAVDGDGSGAVRSLKACVALAESLKNQPDSGSQFLRLSCVDRLVRDGLDQVLVRSSPEETDLKTLADSLMRTERPKTFPRMLAVDHSCMVYWWTHFLENGIGDESEGWLSGRSLRRVSGLVHRSGLLHLPLIGPSRFTADALEICEDPMRRWGRRFKTLEKSRGSRGLFSLLLLPVEPARRSTIFVSNAARVRAACTALAVERYRLIEGRLPPDLKALVPQYLNKVPRDPFVDAPLRFRSLHSGYVVYSVGPNRRDDAGSGKKIKEGQVEGWPKDIAICIRRKASR